jgi:hypothetical protein
MKFMPQIRLAWLLVIAAGCESASSVFVRRSGPTENAFAGQSGLAPATHQEGAADMAGSKPSAVGGPFRELIPLLNEQTHSEQPHSAAAGETASWYGIWVADRNATRTWMRIERPLIHIVGIDKKTGAGWAMDGHYAVAANGMMYGVMTALAKTGPDPERARALMENDERALRGQPVEKKMMPFACQLRLDGPDLTVADFRGTCMDNNRDLFLHGRYQQTSVGRPSCAVPGAPLGTWVNDSGRGRLTMVIQPGRFEFRFLDRLSGRRINVAGNYDVAADGIIFGVLTSVEHGAVAKMTASGHIPPQVLCFRYGFRTSALVIGEVHSLGLRRDTEESLIGEYRPPNEAAK